MPFVVFLEKSILQIPLIITLRLIKSYVEFPIGVRKLTCPDLPEGRKKKRGKRRKGTCFMIASPGTLANMMIAAGDTDGNNNLTLDEIINAEGTEVLSDLIGNLILK